VNYIFVKIEPFFFCLNKKKQKFKERSSANAQAGKPPLPFLAPATSSN
jgi:hypothetical protein